MTLLTASALAAACGGSAPAPAAAPKAATVTAPVKEATLTTVTLTPEAEKRLALMTAPVERKEIVRTRTVGGEVIPASGSALSITAPVAGTLQSSSLPVAGTLVSRGQMLFRLLPLQASERDASATAQQAADTATARREMSAQKVRRAEQLVRDGAGSRRSLEEAQAELAVAEAELKAARDRVALASRGDVSGGVAIEAPDAAVVQAVHVRNGQAVAAGAPLVELVGLATVWLRVPIYAGEANAIDRRAPARVLGLGDPSDADGTIAQPIASPPSADPTTAGVDLYYALPNANRRFRPGERVAVRLTRSHASEGLVVPKAALLHDVYGGTWVYVLGEPRVYARQRVTVTDINGPLASLSQGPAVGARVVTDGAAELFGVEFGAGK